MFFLGCCYFTPNYLSWGTATNYHHSWTLYVTTRTAIGLTLAAFWNQSKTNNPTFCRCSSQNQNYFKTIPTTLPICLAENFPFHRLMLMGVNANQTYIMQSSLIVNIFALPDNYLWRGSYDTTYITQDKHIVASLVNNHEPKETNHSVITKSTISQTNTLHTFYIDGILPKGPTHGR